MCASKSKYSNFSVEKSLTIRCHRKFFSKSGFCRISGGEWRGKWKRKIQKFSFFACGPIVARSRTKIKCVITVITSDCVPADRWRPDNGSSHPRWYLLPALINDTIHFTFFSISSLISVANVCVWYFIFRWSVITRVIQCVWHRNVMSGDRSSLHQPTANYRVFVGIYSVVIL